MKNDRRKFIRQAGLAGLAGTGSSLCGLFPGAAAAEGRASVPTEALQAAAAPAGGELSVIGLYGPWAASFNDRKIPTLSFRRPEWSDLEAWRKSASRRLAERLAIPDLGGLPPVTVKRKFTHDGLYMEELSWQLPYGRPTDALLLKPADAKAPLPGILALHDHGGNKFFGTGKITRTDQARHPMMVSHQDQYYGGRAWANEIARRGYVVLVSDAFPFASRRVMLQDVPERIRTGLSDPNPEDPKAIASYNKWAAEHETVMAKSLFCAGTTWPGVFVAEDRKALDILAARQDVIPGRLGCAGLSGGGMRTVFLAGTDPRIRCAIPVGFMSTWKDFLLHKSFTHTWMTYVPLLPNELDFPEILGLHVPRATLVLNDREDALYTMPEMTEADRILKEVYRKAGAADRYRCSFYPGPHKFDAEMQKEAFDWFDRWLKS